MIKRDDFACERIKSLAAHILAIVTPLARLGQIILIIRSAFGDGDDMFYGEGIGRKGLL